MPPRPLHPAMAPWCHVQSPLLEVRTPMAIAIWGKKPVLSDKEALDYHQFILETPLVKHGASTTDVGSDNPTHSDFTPLLEAQPL